MKTFALRTALAALLLAGALTLASAQTTPAGYWVVETNNETRDYSLVQFYDPDDQLLYEERLQGVHLDVSRRKTIRLLNGTLRRVTNRTLLGSQLARNETTFAVSPVRKRLHATAR